MIVIDANLLIYAYNSEAPQHNGAREWLEQTFSSPELIGLPIESIYAFLRISTTPRSSGYRLSIEQALELVDSWLAIPHVTLLLPERGYWSVLKRMLLQGKAAGRLVTDAQIAAITAEYGGTLYTDDRDFARFPGLNWINPLEN